MTFNDSKLLLVTIELNSLGDLSVTGYHALWFSPEGVVATLPCGS